MSDINSKNGNLDSTEEEATSLWEQNPLRFCAGDLSTRPPVEGPGTSRIDREVWRRWEAVHAAGDLNYHVTDVVTQVLPGKYGLVTQVSIIWCIIFVRLMLVVYYGLPSGAIG